MLEHPKCLVLTLYGVPIWFASDVPGELYAGGAFPESRYARVIKVKLEEMNTPIERVEVHVGIVLLFIFRAESQRVALPVMCDDTTTIWDRLILGKDVV